MNASTYLLPTALCLAFLAGCASGPPPAKEFPAGARAPNAAEITGLLKGKSFTQAGGVRTDYAADSNAITAYFSGRTDSGTWRAEDGRVCFELKTLSSVCNDLRVVGNEIYLKRRDGQVVKLEPR